MRINHLLPVLLVTLAMSAPAALFNYSFTNGAVIPNGDVNGWQNTQVIGTDTMGVEYSSISDVNVTLNITGGFNGDLYGYLVHDSGFAVLLNRVGTGLSTEPTYTFGYANAGFNNVTLDDAASVNGSIHAYGGVSVPTDVSYQPDGGTLSSFNDLNPHGNWTLFFADLSGGEASPSTLVSWGLTIEAVPEPVNLALGVFAGLGLLGAGWRAYFGKRKSVRVP